MQPLYEITVHPIDLSKHGKTPKGLPLYRIVWANTRKTRLVYKGELKIIPRYLVIDSDLADQWPITDEEKRICKANMGAHWILERWKSADEFVGMSSEQYETITKQFPWAPTEAFPYDGEYDFECWFPGNIDEGLINKAIWLRESRRMHVGFEERKAEAVAAEELREERQDQKFTEMCEQAREESFK